MASGNNPASIVFVYLARLFCPPARARVSLPRSKPPSHGELRVKG